MKHFSIFNTMAILAIVAAAGFAFTPSSFAQGTPNNGQPAQQQTPPATPTTTPATTGQAAPATAPLTMAEVPKIDPAEETAYKAFSDLKPEEKDKQIQLGEQFVQKYPLSKYDLQVYTQLTQDYYDKNDVDKMYASGDKALALNPDDVSVLVLVGWVIPHSSHANDLEGDRMLDKAEKYEKHALELLATLPKPATLTDEQFAKVKIQAQSEAHSGLGLVYFRRQDFANSIAELQQGVSTAPSPDPTDYFVMGRELDHLNRLAEAVDAYQKCSQIPGPLQNNCKQLLDQAKTKLAAAPAAPKQ